MSSGKPDWYTSAVLTGKYGIQFLPVAVDGDGNIKAVLQGSSLITGEVNATDLNTLKQIQGIEGATYRTIAVDSLGQLIAVMKSAAGNNVVVDASGFLSAILKGTYATAGDKNIAVDSLGQLIAVMKSAAGNNVVVDASGFLSAILKGTYAAAGDKNLAVDINGNLVAKLKALYGAITKDVQTDANGNLTLNLKAQDLAEIINRPKYGAAKVTTAYGARKLGAPVTMISVAGKGVTYGGFIQPDTGYGLNSDNLILTIDGEDVGEDYFTFENMLNIGMQINESTPFQLSVYNDANKSYRALFKKDLTFESNIVFKYQSSTEEGSVKVIFIYALV